MKAQLVLLLAVGFTSGHVIPAIRRTVIAPAPVVVTQTVASQYHAQDELGQYSYGYNGGPSAKHEAKTVDGVTRGGYSYVDGNGLVQSAAYVSDPVNGFRVAATNLPAGPAVPTSVKTAVVSTGPAVAAVPVGAVVSKTVLTAAPVAPILAAAVPARLVSTPVVANVPVVAAARIIPGVPVFASSSLAASGSSATVDITNRVVSTAASYVAHPSPTPAVTILQSGHAAAIESASAANAAAAAANSAAAATVAAKAAVESATAANSAALAAASAKSAADAEALQAERIAAARAASTLTVDTPEVVQAKSAHLAAVEATKARDAELASKEAQENAVVSSGAAAVGESTVLAARTGAVVAHTPSVINNVEIGSAGPSVVTVTSAPALVASAVPAVVTATAAPVVVASVTPVITRTAAVVAPAAAVVASVPAVAVARTATVLAPAAAVISAPAVAVARTAVVGSALAINPVVSSQYHAQDELGQYTFGYSGGPSAKHETRTIDGITKGGYSYIDAHGQVQNAAYVSDPVNGFRVAASNIPVQPGPKYIADSAEVAAAKTKLFQLQAEHVAKL